MKLSAKISCIFVLVTILQSCGVVTHARYGNGYKLNIGNNWGKGEGKTDYNNTSKKTPAFCADRYRSSGSLEILKEEIEFSETEELKPVEFLNTGRYASSVDENIRSEKKDTALRNKDVIIPYEPNALLGTKLVYGSIIAAAVLLLIAVSDISKSVFFVLVGIQILFIIAAFVGFFMAIKGIINIKKNKGKFKGKGLASSSIALFLLSIIYYLMIVMLFAIFIGF